MIRILALLYIVSLAQKILSKAYEESMYDIKYALSLYGDTKSFEVLLK